MIFSRRKRSVAVAIATILLLPAVVCAEVFQLPPAGSGG